MQSSDNLGIVKYYIFFFLHEYVGNVLKIDITSMYIKISDVLCIAKYCTI